MSQTKLTKSELVARDAEVLSAYLRGDIEALKAMLARIRAEQQPN